MSELIRIEADGTRVVRKNNRIYRIAPATEPVGKYRPFKSRADMMRGRKDHRKSDWYAEAIRETRKNPMLKITLRRGKKTKTVKINPSLHRASPAGPHGYHVWAQRGSVAWYATKAEAERVRDQMNYRGGQHYTVVSEKDIAGKRRNPSRGRDSGLDTTQTELKLFIDNDGDLYRQMTAPIQKNLTKKFVKGTYNHTKAVKLWKYLADEGAKRYAKEFSIASDWNTMFSVADRKEVAQHLADDWLDEMKAGNRHNPPRKASNLYRVGGRGKAVPYENAIARANTYYRRTGVFLAVEKVKPRVFKTKLR